LTVTLDGQPLATPSSIQAVVGVRRTLGVVSPQSRSGVSYEFASWSDGGAAQHSIATPVANTTYIANFRTISGGGSSVFAPIRVNAGGSAYTDPQARVWSADTGYLHSTVYYNPHAVSSTTAPPLYQVARVGATVLAYRFNVPNGQYTLNLKFAEIHPDAQGSGRRIFNIVVNGVTVQPLFDVFATAGGGWIAIDRSYPVAVTRGEIEVLLVPTAGQPLLAALEITGGRGFIPIRLNCGGTAYTDPQNRWWGPDTSYTMLSSTLATSSTITNTTTPPLYQNARTGYGDLGYIYRIPNGSYQVTLKFAELVHTSAGRRAFDVYLNGQTVLWNFDPFVRSGGTRVAVDRSFPVSVTNGLLSIRFKRIVGEPIVNAVEITPH
jgi:hypothetical protein